MQLIFDYDPAPLEVRVDSRYTSHADWIREWVSYATASGGVRMSAVPFLPKRHAPPHQTLVFFPGSDARPLRIAMRWSRGGRTCAGPSIL